MPPTPPPPHPRLGYYHRVKGLKFPCHNNNGTFRQINQRSVERSLLPSAIFLILKGLENLNIMPIAKMTARLKSGFLVLGVRQFPLVTWSSWHHVSDLRGLSDVWEGQPETSVMISSTRLSNFFCPTDTWPYMYAWMGMRCWPWEHKWSRTWQRESRICTVWQRTVIFVG